ncbi:MAG: hypothetical protein A2268_02745 [Candidatus Raymondbacteria bacterium RifOxyA12_full_50_37]|uniref:Uncharacterized protein n=1 Tax=Candidatus Raymondbacteria bacterium RIFOXYD12_FULL_49_13 TaxID=1817890 RepID=A0A1F7FJA9_UNCRA|nr:MAG: hypothetical protein A2268_02745 [Candidatus Raymondbacteria bacterium RifOxyA12_full_50_37]OGJ90603.1 MAG: hypothetical protein A2248_02405 [Candidatus Raymondbacteria bacterium RIFOXYA2_FULL_49_16]OGK02412.1 MAG: hypothetical protein A2350_13535 [Candidatus Raymondbacteria bacterium RifOxyB12_full_50_8]OGK06723.1 MAG: hypothetical protein A2519_21565 [Candidatus Raymondbacteria bacterium RIFOXYD12_FULL_49_13]OGP43456.1 MAG: hypothetical protein A2324_18780 [Candidatus Raymondbacteria 
MANAIMACRTAQLGGHVYQCDSCGHEHISYNSCRNRHCPQCQALARSAWVQARMDDLLPVPYFHAVFTIPPALNPFALRNKEAFYALMFKAVSETLLELAKNKKRLGAVIGFIAILHTWGQNLMDHPHIHCVVPGGGIQETRWIHCRRKFLFPIRVLSALFKGKLMAYFREAVTNNDIQFHGALAAHKDPIAFQSLIDDLYAQDWVIYVKPPFAGPQAVLKYLGSYTHRIAISNRRIISIKDGMVSFTWKDYAHGNVRKVMAFPISEFIRRFLLHVVPKGFVRIRHYGFLGNRTRKTSIAACRKALGVLRPPEEKRQPRSWVDLCKQLTGNDPTLCPMCGTGHLRPFREITASPPGYETVRHVA